MDRLITEYEVELAEPGCSPGVGRYGLLITVPDDISPSFPYLNAVLDDTLYDHENRVLMGGEKGRRYAFRPNDIRVAGIPDVADAPHIAEDVVGRINQVWQDRGEITPSFRERKVPATFDIYTLLPRSNCKQCGYPTCLAFAADACNNPELLENCPPLSRPENADSRVQIERLSAGD